MHNYEPSDAYLIMAYEQISPINFKYMCTFNMLRINMYKIER